MDLDSRQNPGTPGGDQIDAGPSLLEAARRYRLAIVLTGLCGGLVGWFASLLQPVAYETTASLLLADPRNVGVFREAAQTTLDPSRYVRNQAQFATSTPVLARAKQLAPTKLTLRQLQRRVAAQPAAELDLVTITASDATAEGAARLADAVGQAYQDVSAAEIRRNAQQAIAEIDNSRSELQARIDGVESQLAVTPDDASLQAQRDAAVAELVALEGRGRQIAVDAALYGSGVELFERAPIPESPSQPRPARNASVAGLLAAMSAGAVAWWRAGHAQRADGRHDPAAVLGAPLLGEVPDFASAGIADEVPALSAPRSAAGEAYNFLTASLEFALSENGGTTVLITSAGPSDGKTVTALNLAIAAVRDGRRVILVDADARLRGLTRLSHNSGHPGLPELADETLPYDHCVATIDVAGAGRLPFVPAGGPLVDPAAFFRTPKCRKAMVRAREHADFVVVDTPPLLAVADTSAIASQADGIVVVVARGTPLRQLIEVRERLAFIGTPVLGYVFNRSDLRHGRYGYGYGPGSAGQGRHAASRRRGRWQRRRRRALTATAAAGWEDSER